MPFNPETYDIYGRPAYIKGWINAEEILADKGQHEYIRTESYTHAEAYAHVHMLNRVRNAWQAQKIPAKRFNHIGLSIIKTNTGRAFLKFRIKDNKPTEDFIFVERTLNG